MVSEEPPAHISGIQVSTRLLNHACRQHDAMPEKIRSPRPRHFPVFQRGPSACLS